VSDNADSEVIHAAKLARAWVRRENAQREVNEADTALAELSTWLDRKKFLAYTDGRPLVVNLGGGRYVAISIAKDNDAFKFEEVAVVA
jgi:hypothetical protein